MPRPEPEEVGQIAFSRPVCPSCQSTRLIVTAHSSPVFGLMRQENERVGALVYDQRAWGDTHFWVVCLKCGQRESVGSQTFVAQEQLTHGQRAKLGLTPGLFEPEGGV
jgi:hypothetical protein